jgi:hypothetical protein
MNPTPHRRTATPAAASSRSRRQETRCTPSAVTEPSGWVMAAGPRSSHRPVRTTTPAPNRHLPSQRHAHKAPARRPGAITPANLNSRPRRPRGAAWAYRNDDEHHTERTDGRAMTNAYEDWHLAGLDRVRARKHTAVRDDAERARMRRRLSEDSWLPAISSARARERAEAWFRTPARDVTRDGDADPDTIQQP